MYTDLDPAQLARYRSSQTLPEDFQQFWQESLAAAREHTTDITLEPVNTGLSTLEIYDVTFPGWNGEPVRAWLRVPRNPAGPLPAVVQYVGYGGGRGDALENLLWASAGYAHLQMDTRGQGSGWSKGATPDPAGSGGPQVPGVMTRGILDRDTYYYRRLFVDAARAVDAASAIHLIDPDRIAVLGQSQGGGTALAVSVLCPEVRALVARVPFLCDFPRALQITDAYPYKEIGDYLSTHRAAVEPVLETLSYFDGVNFAAEAAVPALFSVALMDEITPPSTVYAAYNAYAGPKDLSVWPYNGHEAGAVEDDAAALAFLRDRLA